MADVNPGDVVRISATFADDAGVAADPSAVTLNVRLRKFGATSVSYIFGTDAEVVKDAVGEYHLDYSVPEISPDRGLAVEYEWVGTGAVTAVEQGSFAVSNAYG